MKSKLVLIGGVSGVGKTTILTKICEGTGCNYFRMFDLVSQYGKKEDIFENWKKYELKAVEKINSLSSQETILIDLHYSIQPSLDNALALSEKTEERISESYLPSLTFENFRIMCSDITTLMFYLYAEPELIQQRRIIDENKGIKMHRSLSLQSIVHELENEKLFFNQYAKLLHNEGFKFSIFEVYNGNISLDTVTQNIIGDILD